VVKFYFSCPKKKGTCCPDEEYEKPNYWKWGNDPSDICYLTSRGLLVSLKRDVSIHMFDAKYDCNNNKIAENSDISTVINVLACIVTKLEVQKGLYEKKNCTDKILI
jgi:hypothetical protein